MFVLYLGCIAELVVDLAEHLGHISLASQQCDASVLLFLEVKQLVGDAQQVVHVTTYGGGVLIGLHLFQWQAHQREWRTDFVDEVDEEPDLRLESLLLLFLLELSHLLLVATLQALLGAIEGVEYGSHGEQDVESIGEGSAIPRRQDGDAQLCCKGVVGLSDLTQPEHVFAWWQVGIGGLWGGGFMSPCAVKALEHVLILCWWHATIARRSKV